MLLLRCFYTCFLHVPRMNEGANQVLHKLDTTDAHQPILSATHFHPVRYIYPWHTAGCSLLMQWVLSEQPVLSGITSYASATAAQLRVASIHREGLLPYPPVAGFQVPSSQQNDIRAAQVAEMAAETKHKSSSKQANVTLSIPNSSAVLTTLTMCYENQCLIMHLKILIVSKR